uniref:Alternative protein ASPH n=1 Tax=Homo sapiens TaxID=9606 RepID=L8EA92_HUMAN|nr:alternative protein ASPH [Homo sapiens]
MMGDFISTWGMPCRGLGTKRHISGMSLGTREDTLHLSGNAHSTM